MIWETTVALPIKHISLRRRCRRLRGGRAFRVVYSINLWETPAYAFLVRVVVESLTRV